MAEQGLHDPEVRSSFQEVCRERMAQHVRADLGGIDPGCGCGLVQQLGEPARAQPSAGAA